MIECSNLTMKYDNKKIINNFNYIFEDNNITSIVGPSGRGKTTLLRCIAGLNKITSGNVFYHKKNKERINITKPNKDIFMMHQHYSNFPWLTCYDNLIFPLKLNKKDTMKSALEACTLLEKVGLGECMTKYPEQLSGGMNQRLAFIRTLIMEPKILLMDEPMSALDKKTRETMQNLLLKMHEKTKNTIILITHSEEEAKKLSNNIIYL